LPETSSPGPCDSGAKWYCETSAGYLDALLHGLLGLRPGKPGYAAVILEPQFPSSWEKAQLSLCLPNRSRLDVDYRAGTDGTTLKVSTSGEGGELPITIGLPWRGEGEPKIEWTGTKSPRLETSAGRPWLRAETKGAGQLSLRLNK